MSNQNLIDYQLSLEAKNTEQINDLQKTNNQLNNNIGQLNEAILQIQNQIIENNQKISILENGNVMIQETIAFIPPNQQ